MALERPRPLLTRGVSLLEGYPHIIQPIDAESAAHLWKSVPGLRTGATLVGDDMYVYPKVPAANLAAVYQYPVDRRDVWVVSLPCSGATWLQELVWLVASGCDWQGAEAELWPVRWEWAEMKAGCLFSPSVTRDIWWQMVKSSIRNVPRILWGAARTAWYSTAKHLPRFVNTHMPLAMLPQQLLDRCKVIYLARNPKDVLVSYYHHHKLFLPYGWEGTFQDFFDLFLSNKLIQMSFFPHVHEAWEKRHHPNILFIFYEDLQKDLRAVVRRVADFLRIQVSDIDVERLCDHLSFSSMKSNPSVQLQWLRDQGLMSETSSVFRSGQAGEWWRHFTPEMNARMDAWVDENLRGSDLRFTYQVKQDE